MLESTHQLTRPFVYLILGSVNFVFLVSFGRELQLPLPRLKVYFDRLVIVRPRRSVLVTMEQ